MLGLTSFVKDGKATFYGVNLQGDVLEYCEQGQNQTAASQIWQAPKDTMNDILSVKNTLFVSSENQLFSFDIADLGQKGNRVTGITSKNITELLVALGDAVYASADDKKLLKIENGAQVGEVEIGGKALSMSAAENSILILLHNKTVVEVSDNLEVKRSVEIKDIKPTCLTVVN